MTLTELISFFVYRYGWEEVNSDIRSKYGRVLSYTHRNATIYIYINEIKGIDAKDEATSLHISKLKELLEFFSAVVIDNDTTSIAYADVVFNKEDKRMIKNRFTSKYFNKEVTYSQFKDMVFEYYGVDIK